jgi:DNA replicative helicase MCM subunit Mcm2 (Cdc46/Mcm family)
MRSAYFLCNTCSFHVQVEIDRGRIAEPTVCTSCNTSHSFELIHNRSLFADKQFIKLQETPGKKPNRIFILIYVVLCRGDACWSNTGYSYCRST